MNKFMREAMISMLIEPSDEVQRTTWAIYYLNSLTDNDEVVYPFWIDAWEKEELGELEKIYIKVETIADANIELLHGNYPATEDLKITIPFKL